METIKGTISNIRYQNPDNGWSVAGVKVAERGGIDKANLSGDGEACVVGILPGIRKGMSFAFHGEWTASKYGVQLQVSSFEETEPDDTEGIEKYLASGMIKEIGPVYAKAIVAAFGVDTLRIIDNEPERLREVRGIGRKRVESIIESAKEHRGVRDIMVWLKSHGLPNGMSARLFATYGTRTVPVLENNPYILVDDMDGVGFLRADDVARKIGISPESPVRIRAALVQCLKDAASAGGHTCLAKDDLVAAAASDGYLRLPLESILPVLDEMLADGKELSGDGLGNVFLPGLHRAEEKVAGKLIRLIGSAVRPIRADIPALQARTGVRYAPEQADAIISALEEPVTVITGGPGTGKTVTTNAIITALEEEGLDVLLAAPTGRAAKRMNEVSGREAKTIHRLLEYSRDGFTYGEEMPLAADAVIIDEVSMVDVYLMQSLLAAISEGTRLVLVGDVDQLPSVGPGCVLRDMIASGAVPTVRLMTIYRQAQDSGIVMNAHRINRGLPPDYALAEDFRLVEAESTEEIADRIVSLVTRELPAEIGVSPDDIQVLSPMRREYDPIGATRLNARLRERINPGTETGGFRPGDKVMQMKNNYDKNVFNGDIGRVVGIHPMDGSVDVLINGETLSYEEKELQQLDLAYATSIHKSQGSEYPVVVIPVHKSHYILLKRNLLYTGVTRAKRLCVLVGTKDAAAMAARTVDGASRSTLLDTMLQKEKDRMLSGEGEGRLFL